MLRQLLVPTRIYVRTFQGLSGFRRAIHGVAHITGGGLEENLPRVFAPDLDAVVRRGSWPVPRVFTTLQRTGSVDSREMYRVFNMGIGLVLIVDPEGRGPILRALKNMGESAHEIGIMARGKNRVRFV
jgi:phosphoribosylformylglycinamidine cyclo-ligase